MFAVQKSHRGKPRLGNSLSPLSATFDGGTELTLIHEHLPDVEARKSHEEGWRGLSDKLPVFLGDAEWST
jgi:hypothetical protein